MARIVLQAGHCHRKSGSVGTQTRDGSFTEQQFTWAVANRAAELIRNDGHTASVILADPRSTSAYRGDCFIAIHADGNNSPKVGGASVGYRTNEGKGLAHAWKAAYRKLGWSHGFRSDNYTAALGGYYGVKRAVGQGTRRACILEFGFLTNPAEAAELRSPEGQNRAARSIRCAAYASLGIAAPDNATASLEDDMAPHVERILAGYRRVRSPKTHDYDPRRQDPNGWDHWMESLQKATTADDRNGVVFLCLALLAREAGL